MKTKQHKIFLILLAVSLISFAGQLCLLPSLPAEIPIHWNAAGEIDNYGSKWMTLLFGALPLLMLLLFLVIPKMDPKKESYAKHMGPYLILVSLMTLLMIVVSWITTLAAIEIRIPVERVVPGMIGVLSIVLGNYMPRIRHNYTFGIRTAWTLASETVWKKTHRAGGICFVAFGIVLLLNAFWTAGWLSLLSTVMIIAEVVFLFLYSWLLYRKEQKK